MRKYVHVRMKCTFSAEQKCSGDTKKLAKEFKHYTEIPMGMSSTFVLRTTPLTPVNNQRHPLRLLGGCSGNTKKTEYF